MQDTHNSPPQAPKEDSHNGDIVGFQAIAEVYFNWENGQHAENELFLKTTLKEQASLLAEKYQEPQRTITREAMKNYADIIEPKSRACIANVMEWQSGSMSSEKMKSWSKGFVKEFEKEREKNYLRKTKSTHTIWFQKLLKNLEIKQREERESINEEKREKKTVEQILEELANKKKKLKDKNKEINKQENSKGPEEEEKQKEGDLEPGEADKNSQEQEEVKKKRKNKKKKKALGQETKSQEKEEKKQGDDLTVRENALPSISNPPTESTKNPQSEIIHKR